MSLQASANPRRTPETETLRIESRVLKATSLDCIVIADYSYHRRIPRIWVLVAHHLKTGLTPLKEESTIPGTSMTPPDIVADANVTCCDASRLNIDVTIEEPKDVMIFLVWIYTHRTEDPIINTGFERETAYLGSTLIVLSADSLLKLMSEL
ncbi:hypothetical protein U9M48_039239 [Paspalum notatum var. saurae]|uniref:Uncharacterized protein n=1 Tax=Paspalum notatum var. saurae TaxID=547442 RepID=A0AAQ3UJR2_PASNO